LTTAETGLALIRSCGISVSISWTAHALLDRTLHADQTDAVLVLEQLADRAHAAVAEVVDVVDALGRVGAVLQVDEVLDRAEDVLAAQRRELAQRDLLAGAVRPVRLPR
jgi:hypothetical protein